MINQPWVINASPLILLGKINQLVLFEQLASSLIVPESVYQEIARGEPNTFRPKTLDWTKEYVKPDINVPISILNWDIGAGESQVLAYCLKHQGCKAILDDGQARAAALSHRIQLIGTLGIILRAKRSGLVVAAQPLIEQLILNGSYLSPSLVQAALLKVDE